MHPAFSVIFLTTLIGVGQGLFLALYTGQLYTLAKLIPTQDDRMFYGLGSLIALAFLVAGLVASIFHLGRPSRGWRAASQWRTSWLSREIIMLPLFMVTVSAYGAVNYLGWNAPLFLISETLPVNASLLIGAVGTVFAYLLLVTTAMIYACLKFLQEWYNPLTVFNYILLGSASPVNNMPASFKTPGFVLPVSASSPKGRVPVAAVGNWYVLTVLRQSY